MVYTFEIISQEVKNFKIELQIDGSETFNTLHECIQKGIGFQSHQLSSFFIPNNHGKKTVEISMLDPGINGFPYYSMFRTRISRFINNEIRNLLYTYDLFNDRSFILKLTGIYMEKSLKEPSITLVEGDAPVQILEEEKEVQETSAKQEDEVFQDFGVLEDYTEIFGEMDPI